MKIICILFVILFILITLNNQKNIPIQSNIYVINLDRDTERMNKMNNQLSNIKYNRISAVIGNNLDIDNLKNDGLLNIDNDSFVYSKSINKDTYKGSIGCALSHINLWKKVQKLNNEYFVILEDDCKIGKNLLERINNTIKELPDDWDILFLGGSRIYGRKINNNLIKMEYVNSWMNCGLFAYIIRKKSIEKILSYALPINTYIDMQINKEYGKNINAYYSYPNIVGHDYSDGSTRDEYRNKYTKKFQEEANRVVIIN